MEHSHEKVESALEELKKLDLPENSLWLIPFIMIMFFGLVPADKIEIVDDME